MLVIIADITAKPDKVELVKTELEKLVGPTRAEKGCIQYDLHQDRENPAHLFFYERWESRELWQDHMQTQHIKDLGVKTEGAIESLVVSEMDHIA